MLRRSFPPWSPCVVLTLAVATAASACTIAVEAAPTPPPAVRIRLDHEPVTVPQGTTYGVFAEGESVRARDGRLLSVTGEILERHVSEGTVELNGHPPDPLHVLATGDRIVRLEGEDRIEGTRRVTTRLRGRTNAFVQRTLATFRVREVTTVGRISGEVADLRVDTNGRPRMPPAVALTFDDGPWPGHTEAVLRVLRRERVRATFFMIGSLVVERPDLVRKVLHAGHVVANHSLTHPVAPAFAELPAPRVEAEIAQTVDALRGAGAHPTLFRPPGGSYDDGTILEAWRQRERVVMWSVDPHDWDASRTPKQIAKDVLRRVRAGSIVLLHDGGGDAADTIAALPRIIRGIRKMDLRLVTLDPYRRR